MHLRGNPIAVVHALLFPPRDQILPLVLRGLHFPPYSQLSVEECGWLCDVPFGA